MVQVQEMSYKEKVEMYNLIDKKGLIDMLIEANKCLQMLEQKVKIDFIDSSLQLKEKETITFKEFENALIKRTFENETFYETEQGLKTIEEISVMYDLYLANL